LGCCNLKQQVWRPLPWIEPITSTLSNKYDIAFVRLGGLRLRFTWSDEGNSPPTSNVQYRLVAVSGTAKANNPNVDWNNWNQVKQTFHLTD
jgi:hypothetical protein